MKLVKSKFLSWDSSLCQSSLILKTLYKAYTFYIIANIIHPTFSVCDTVSISRANVVLFPFIPVTFRMSLSSSPHVSVFIITPSPWDLPLGGSIVQCLRGPFQVRKVWVCELSSCRSLLLNLTRSLVLHLKKKLCNSRSYGTKLLKLNNVHIIFSTEPDPEQKSFSSQLFLRNSSPTATFTTVCDSIIFYLSCYGAYHFLHFFQ